jgi:Mlc titration factor MtfA (ptsG expression regulator)
MLNYYLLLIQFLFALVGLFLFWQSLIYFRTMWKFKKLKLTPFPESYEKVLHTIDHYRSLSSTYKKTIHLFVLAFLDDKEFIEAKMTITDEIKIIIAFYASLMRLGFEFGEKDNVKTVIVYPEHFIVDQSDTLQGIRHHKTNILEGQSANGIVVISWQGIKDNLEHLQNQNVIIHEFAHELDFEDGIADGTPVLEGSNYSRWSNVFTHRFGTLRTEVKKGEISENIALLGLYALKNEAEFFAVCSERFFQVPKTFKQYFPDIYKELMDFYRLDTAVLFKDLSEP